MTKLYDHELSWKSLIWEVIGWGVCVLIFWIWTFPPWEWVYQCHEWADARWRRYLMAQPANGGLGTLSFISTVTGLNLVLVKFQSFLKAQEDVQQRWSLKSIKRAMDERPELSADEPTAQRLKDEIRAECAKHIDALNEKNVKHWAYWSRWSVRASVVGFVCLALGYSVGAIGGALMICPVVATWIIGYLTASELMTRFDNECNIAVRLAQTLKQTSNEEKEKLTDELVEALIPRLNWKAKKTPKG